MGLVQIGFLGALGALAIPIIIHLVFGRRARRVDLGTLRFLKIVLRENVRRRRLKRWLLLVLRMACLALLAFLFARPYLIARHSGGGDRLMVILLDRSASMGLKTDRGRLLELAIREAKKAAGQGGDETHLEIALFDHDVYPMVGSQGSSGQSSGSLAMLENLAADFDDSGVSYSATNYEAALAWASDACIRSDRTRKELYLFTDLQRSGFTHGDVQPVPPDVDVHLMDFGQAFPENTAITRATPQKLMVRPGEPVTVSVTLLNAGQFALEGVPVVLRINNNQRQQEVRSTVDLEAGATATVQFELQDLTEGLWQGYAVARIDDDLPFDNRHHVALMVADPLRVILIDGDPGASPLTSETYFLEAALRLAPVSSDAQAGDSFVDSPFEPRTVVPGEAAGLPDLSTADLVVLANVARLRATDARRLAGLVQRGGGLLIFGGDKVQSAGYDALENQRLLAGEILGTAVAGDLPLRLDSWEEKHPIFWPFNDPEYGDLRRLVFRAYTRIRPAEHVRVLARFRGGEPAILELGAPTGGWSGRGKVLWCACACDRDWSDWPRSRLYLPMVHQMLGYLAGLAEGGPVRDVLFSEAMADRTDPIPGVFDKGTFHEVINVDPRESELDRCTREEFAARFKLKLQDAGVPPSGSLPSVGHFNAPPNGRAGVTISAQSRPDEIWHWVILPLIVLLLCEQFLANRTTV